MAESGGQPGNQNAAKGHRWRTAIEHVVSRWPEQPDLVDCSDLIRGLRIAARGFVERTMTDQDIAFYREFGDRLDGKPAQTTVLEGNPEKPLSVSDAHLEQIATSK